MDTPDRNEPSETVSFRARWLVPVDGVPIENGTIEIQDGIITAVHGRHDPAAVDLGNVAIIPGLVNAHTHLEFSTLSEPLDPARPFADWIRSLVHHRRTRTRSTSECVGLGLTECRQAGTTLVGEIATEGWSADVFAASPLRSVIFREFISRDPGAIDESMALARAHLAVESAGGGSPHVVRGISPHASFSVHPDLYLKLVELCADRSCPLAIHLAETEAELELLNAGTGELVDMLREFGAWREGVIPHGSRPMDYLRPLADLRNAIVIHGNYLNSEEIDFLSEHNNVAVVYCPRTHAYFGHADHPWREMLARGVLVAVGTDSRGSNPDLSVWRELQLLHAKFPQIAPSILLQLGTRNGARALGLDHLTGSLQPGKHADLAVLALPSSSGSDLESMLFRPDTRVKTAMVDGRWIAE